MKQQVAYDNHKTASLLPPLAIPFSRCLAKTFVTPEGSRLAGRTVFNHCQIVQLHCTVIILSATLTAEHRQALVKATPAPSTAYPLVTSAPINSKPIAIPVELLPNTAVQVQLVQQDKESVVIEEVLTRAEQGQQILWIENTVNEAQAIYQLLGAKTAGMGIACGLLHSRFLKTDRSAHEQRWVTLFGKEGAAQRGEQGRIPVSIHNNGHNLRQLPQLISI